MQHTTERAPVHREAVLCKKVIENVRARAPAAVCIGLLDVGDNGQYHVHADVVLVIDMGDCSCTAGSRVHNVHLAFVMPLLPQRVQ